MRQGFRSGLLVSCILASGLVLSACGGSGGSGSAPVAVSPPPPPPPPPPPTNSAPVFSSANAINVPENALDDFYTVTATDADGDTLDITMTGGADLGQFEFTTDDKLSFENPPNFENPTDADEDNVYEVEFTADDNKGGVTVFPVTVTVTDNPDEKVRNKDITFDRALVDTGVLYRTVGTGANAQELYMDIFTPEGDTATDRPVIILAFGGGFIEGDRAQVAAFAANFALRGYVAAAIDYRLFEDGTPNDVELLGASIDATQDMYAAVRFFREDGMGVNSYGVNPDKIFAGGLSAGAIMSVSLAILDEDDAVVSGTLAPFLANGGLYGDNATERDSAVQGALSISGATLSLDAIDTESAVLYAAHEELDPVVPCGTGDEGSSATGLVVSGGCVMVPAYEAVNVPAELYLAEGAATHVSFSLAEYQIILQGAADLFYANVISRD